MEKSDHEKFDWNCLMLPGYQILHTEWCYQLVNLKGSKFTWSAFGTRLARPQSERWGLSSASSNMLADLIFLWTTDGEQTSCRYLNSFFLRIRQPIYKYNREKYYVPIKILVALFCMAKLTNWTSHGAVFRFWPYILTKTHTQLAIYILFVSLIQWKQDTWLPQY